MSPGRPTEEQERMPEEEAVGEWVGRWVAMGWWVQPWSGVGVFMTIAKLTVVVVAVEAMLEEVCEVGG